MADSEDSDAPVTFWLKDAEAGDESAQQKLWEHFYRRLVGLARTKLREGAKRMADEDDVVIDAFNAFFRGAEEGRFPKLNDRNDLWQVLVMLTARKASDQMKAHGRQKRGNGQVRGESYFLKPYPGVGPVELPSFDNVAGDEATPEFALEVAENFGRLLDQLDGVTLRQIALWKMEGFQNAEIAEKLETTTRTVERKLNLIRQHWSDEV